MKPEPAGLWRGLRRLLAGSTPAPVAAPPGHATLDEEMAAAAGRFAAWLATRNLAGALPLPAALDAALASTEAPGEQLLSDAAAALGQHLRAEHGGQWHDSPWWGLVLQGPAGLAHGRLNVLAMIEKRVQLRDQFSLAGFCSSLPMRFAAEARFAPPLHRDPATLLAGAPAAVRAPELVQEFRAAWQQRHRAPLPLTLLGVRQVDAFLRTHYLVSFVDVADVALAGLLVGEVARGLFGGEWVCDVPCDNPTRVALRFPELDYLPVGRAFKMMTTCPEGDPLDEYVRLIPSARHELRQSSASGSITPSGSDSR